MPVITSLVLVALLLVEVENKVDLFGTPDGFVSVCVPSLSSGFEYANETFCCWPMLETVSLSSEAWAFSDPFIDLTFSPFPFPFLLVPCLRLLGHLVLVCRSIGHDRRNVSLVSCGPRSESWVLLFEHPRDPGPFLPCR